MSWYVSIMAKRSSSLFCLNRPCAARRGTDGMVYWFCEVLKCTETSLIAHFSLVLSGSHAGIQGNHTPRPLIGLCPPPLDNICGIKAGLDLLHSSEMTRDLTFVLAAYCCHCYAMHRILKIAFYASTVTTCLSLEVSNCVGLGLDM